MEISTEAPQKTTNRTPYDPVIPLLGIYPKESKSAYHEVLRTSAFMAALFITDEWMDKETIAHTHYGGLPPSHFQL